MKHQSESSNPTVLVVDDEQSLLDAITYNLRREGWNVATAGAGEEALKLASEIQPDIVVLDVMLPGLDGIQVCRKIRSVSTVPIIFLSARGEDFDRILGLEIGADDYLAKPFVMRELVARVRANLRRSESVNESRSHTVGGFDPAASNSPNDNVRMLKIGRIELDRASRTVRVDGEPVQLKPREFDLLAYLMGHPGVVVSRETLLRDVWQYDFAVDTRTVDVHVRGLRSKLGIAKGEPEVIQTARGHGYSIKADSP